MTPELQPDDIVTSRSAYVTGMSCRRKRYLMYEAPNSTPVRGWQRRKLDLPPTVGIYTHLGVSALFNGSTIEEAVAHACSKFLDEAKSRGIEEANVADDLMFLLHEQQAMIEGLLRAWNRVRLPRLLEEYEVLAVEREEFTWLSEEAPRVGLQSRCDAILRRKSDSRIFIYNPKTVANADGRWSRQWEVDTQLMTETLAVTKRMGERVAGVLIEGFLKGARLEDKNLPITRRQNSLLIYGFRLPGSPPIRTTLYDHAYHRGGGWQRFPVWEETFAQQLETERSSPLAYWVNWLPQEFVEEQFQPIPPIMCNDEAIESAIRQMVAEERRVRFTRDTTDNANDPTMLRDLLDGTAPQNTHSCTYPSTCSMYAICHDNIGDIGDSGLFTPRVPHHNGGSE